MNARPQAWLDPAQDDVGLARQGQLGAPTVQLEKLRLNAVSRRATRSRYPDNDTPPMRRFDNQDSDEAIHCAAAVLDQIRQLDQA